MPHAARRVRLGLLGFGTVGQALARLIQQGAPRPAAAAGAGDPAVELLGALEPAGTLVRSALEKGKSVVTANKLLLAQRGVELAEIAAKSGAGFGIEASV